MAAHRRRQGLFSQHAVSIVLAKQITHARDGVRVRHRLGNNCEQAFGLPGGRPRVAGTGEVANRGAEALGGRGEEDAFGESALVVCVKIGDLWVDDNGDPGAGDCEMPRVGAFDHRQSTQHVPIADHDEFPGLAIAGAARPPSNFENVAQYVFRQRVWPKLTYRP